jgi:hypothetical protein|tara:strand:+ start:659 stop:2710 length:2052 start_codon:yes stop_codon:yes gene_type:complete
MSKKETLHIYVRTSTDGQDVKRQIDMGKKFSEDMNMNHKIWNDEGKSGLKSFEDTREQLVELLWEVDLGVVKHMWVEDYTRLTRLIEDQMKIDRLIIENDLSIYEGLSGNQPYEPTNTMKRMYQMMKTMMGSEQKKDEIKKSIDRKLQKFKDGFYVRGNISFGFNKVDGYLEENEDESKWVKKMFHWYGVDKLSIPQVSNKLKMYGVKTKRGNDWGWESVRVCLKNREYIGVTTYTDRTKDPHKKDKKRYPYPDESRWEVWTNDNLPRIVSDELFEKCQKQLTQNKPQPTKHDYFLHGKVKCSCGNDWGGRTTSRKGTKYKDSSYYMCQNSSRKYYKTNPSRKNLYKKDICNKPKRITTEKLDSWVWDSFIETLKNSTFIKERVKIDLLGTKYDTQSSRKKVNKEFKDINKEVKSLEKSRVNLLKEKYLYSLSDSEFKDIDSSILQKLTELKTDLEKVKKKESLLDKRGEWIDWIGEHHKGVNEYEKLTDVKKRRKVLDIYVDKVKVHYDKERDQHDIQIYFRYPIVNDKLEYTRDNNSKLKWDRWGNSYKIKKGDKVVSLSDINKVNPCVTSFYSTVTDLKDLTQRYFITFIYRYKSSDFVYRKKLSRQHKKLHNLIWNLKSEGLGYRKISKYLNEKNIKSHTGVNFYPSLVSVVYKKIEKKKRLEGYRTITEYNDFDIKMY